MLSLQLVYSGGPTPEKTVLHTGYVAPVSLHYKSNIEFCSHIFSIFSKPLFKLYWPGNVFPHCRYCVYRATTSLSTTREIVMTCSIGDQATRNTPKSTTAPDPVRLSCYIREAHTARPKVLRPKLWRCQYVRYNILQPFVISMCEHRLPCTKLPIAC